jgi:hypothetical protein
LTEEFSTINHHNAILVPNAEHISSDAQDLRRLTLANQSISRFFLFVSQLFH